jgi:AcrR family transcriptional regulator
MDIKSRIGKKADELFRRYGVKSITMDEISEQLGISKKTIYQSFSDKNELVDKVVMDMLHKNQCSCEVRTKKAENAVQEVFLNMENVENMYANLNPSFVHDIERGHPAVYKKFYNYKCHFVFDMIKANIERGKEEKLYRQEMNTEIITRMKMETMLLPFNESVFPRNQFPIIYTHRELTEYYLFGMVTEAGRKLILKYQKERDKNSEK